MRDAPVVPARSMGWRTVGGWGGPGNGSAVLEPPVPPRPCVLRDRHRHRRRLAGDVASATVVGPRQDPIEPGLARCDRPVDERRLARVKGGDELAAPIV